MHHNSPLPFTLPGIQGRKIMAAFDGGRLSSDSGVLLLREAERRLGIADRLAPLIPDRREGARVTHRVADMIPRLGAHVVPPTAGQPGAPCSAHGRVLAVAHPARRDPEHP